MGRLSVNRLHSTALEHLEAPQSHAFKVPDNFKFANSSAHWPGLQLQCKPSQTHHVLTRSQAVISGGAVAHILKGPLGLECGLASGGLVAFLINVAALKDCE